MLERATIIAMLVLSIWYTMKEGEIFEVLGNWFEHNLPSVVHQPVFACPVCMSPWYGSLLYILLWGVSWQWPVVVICTMGINVSINKLSPDKTCGVKK